jgi:hypothetical protein
MQLTLVERECLSKESLHGKLRNSIGALLQHGSWCVRHRPWSIARPALSVADPRSW